MGYILDDCPTVHECCFFIPLRPGVILIGITGLLWAAVFMFGFTEQGINLAVECGLAPALLKPIRYFNGISGVLLAAAHLLLVCGGACESDALCEVYIWAMAAFWALAAAAGVAVSALAALQGHAALAAALPAALLAAALLSLYLTVVVANYRMTLP